jgi:hypothetical protein
MQVYTQSMSIAKDPTRTPTLRSLLSEPSVSTLVKHAKNLSLLDEVFATVLSPALAKECRAANVRGTQLILIVTTPAVAARIRLTQNTLLKLGAEKLNLSLNELAVKVSPSLFKPKPNVPIFKAPSTEAITQFNFIASFLEDKKQ